MTDFWIAAQGAGAAAWDIGEGKIEGGVFVDCAGVGEAAFDSFAERGETLAQGLKALGAGLAGEDAGFGIALGKDEGLVAGGGATIEDFPYFLVGTLAATAGEFGDQLRAFVLKAQAALIEHCAAKDVSSRIAGDYGEGGGEQLAGLQRYALCGEFLRYCEIVNAEGEDGLDLAVMAEGLGCVDAVEAGPAFDHPSGMCLGERDLSSGLFRKIRTWSGSQFAKNSVDHP